jgi:hypothetical protein
LFNIAAAQSAEALDAASNFPKSITSKLAKNENQIADEMRFVYDENHIKLPSIIREVYCTAIDGDAKSVNDYFLRNCPHFDANGTDQLIYEIGEYVRNMIILRNMKNIANELNEILGIFDIKIHRIKANVSTVEGLANCIDYLGKILRGHGAIPMVPSNELMKWKSNIYTVIWKMQETQSERGQWEKYCQLYDQFSKCMTQFYPVMDEVHLVQNTHEMFVHEILSKEQQSLPDKEIEFIVKLVLAYMPSELRAMLPGNQQSKISPATAAKFMRETANAILTREIFINSAIEDKISEEDTLLLVAFMTGKTERQLMDA